MSSLPFLKQERSWVGPSPGDQTTTLTPTGSAARSNTYAGASQSHWLTSGPVDFDTTASLGITRTEQRGTMSEFTREPDGRLVSMRRGTETFYYVPDGRGSVSVLTNGAGLVENVYRYGPYGNAEYALEATPQPFHWNAGYTIDGTIYKYGARYYDTNIGRWSQVDPIPSEPRYAYAANDPINKADPSGYSECGDGSWGAIVDCVANPTDVGVNDWLSQAATQVVAAGKFAVGCLAGSVYGAFAGLRFGLWGAVGGTVLGCAIGGSFALSFGDEAFPKT